MDELAAAAVAAIAAIVDQVRAAREGKVDSTIVLAGLKTFTVSLAANDAKADADLETRFGKVEPRKP